MNIANELKSSQLYEVLEQIQLEKFWPALRDAQITQIAHFNYVKPKDLEAIGMSKPAIRRLLDCINKVKKQPVIRPPPPLPPAAHLSTESKLYNKNLNTSALTTKIISSNKKLNQASTSSIETKPVSVLINPTDIQIVKNTKNQDEILGVGNFGIVKKAIWSSHTGYRVQVAVKCLHESKQTEAFGDLVNEISCMCGLDHKNLIKLYGIVLNTNNVMMVTELAANGSLYSYLKKKRENKSMMLVSKLYSYIYQIASGMEYLETKKLIHRDLAARNILLYTFDQVKICDFGMTRSVKNEQNEVFTMKESHKIPAAWFAPESIKEKLFSIKSDVWMFGITIWEIFTLCEHPWPNMTAAEILNKIDNGSQRLPIPYICSKSFYTIVYQCWSKNQADRPSFQSLRKLIQGTKIIEMKAKTSFKEENRLEIEANDLITVIDGDAAKHWWKGQNIRTLLVGHFPRAVLNPQRKIESQDISLPLKNSFIHTGHMSAGSKDKTWGNPGKIDPIFLISMNPPDLLSNLIDEDSNSASNETVQIVNSIVSSSQSNDLIDLLDNSNIQISYPDYSGSIDSFYESSSSSSSNLLVKQNNNNSNNYINDQFNLNDYLKSDVYYNDEISQQSLQYDKPKECFPAKIITSHNSIRNEPKNPFLTRNNYTAFELKKQESKFFNCETNSKVNVDDFLNKVMNDVMNDFKNIKINK